MMDVKTWIINWFSNNCDEKLDIDNCYEDNYFESGLIDSYKFIMLLSDIEEEYNIQFENDKFQDREFSTIKGLIKALEEEVNSEG